METQWAEGHSYDGLSQTTGSLSAWYADMQQNFPDINASNTAEVTDGEDNPRVAGYSISSSVIYADFRWSEAENAYAAVRSLAVKHGVGFFNVSSKDGEIWFLPTGNIPDTTAISGFDSKKNIKIPGNGTYFTIKANEQLSNKNVKAILLSFAQGKSRPQEFVWRDITALFGT